MIRTALAILVFFISAYPLGILTATISSSAPHKRVALVIGNSAYSHVTKLTNPANDARAIAAKLKHIGFEVTLKLDQDYSKLRRSLAAFARGASGAEISLIYYAGHGIEVGGENYLIPIDARLDNSSDVDFETIPLRTAMSALARTGRLKLVILDACRNNPFAARMSRTNATRSIGRGLARTTPRGNDTLVAYAAREGTTADDGKGKHSPYTTALLKHLETPGLEIRLMFGRIKDSVMAATNDQQEPFTYGSLGGSEIYMKPGRFDSTAKSNDVDASELAKLRRAIEDLRAGKQPERSNRNEAAELWKTVKNSKDHVVLKAFAKRYSDSFYAVLAKARLKSLQKQKLALISIPKIKKPKRIRNKPLKGFRVWVQVKNKKVRQKYCDLFARHGLIVKCEDTPDVDENEVFLKCPHLPKNTGKIIKRILRTNDMRVYDWRFDKDFGPKYCKEYDAISLEIIRF